MSEPEDPSGEDGLRKEWLKLRSVVHDRVTGLSAYPLLFDRLRAELDRRQYLGVFHIEIVNLPLVESLYGWQLFDRVLARVAASLTSAVGTVLPERTLLAVNGVAGDRFVAFLPSRNDGGEVTADLLAAVGDEIRNLLDGVLEEDEFAGLSPKLTSRTGHALLSHDPFYRFERRVRAAVEEARTLHRRRLDRRKRSRGQELKRIIRDAAVSTVFQPVVELRTRKVLGFEALSRGPKGSFFEMPRAMFAVSSDAGVEADLDRLCRDTALRSWGRDTRPGKVFVNVASASLLDAASPAVGLDRALDELPLPPGNLVIEIAERALDRELERLTAAVERIRSRGVAIALDDVGTGYATLTTLETVRPDFLKVDASLVHRVDHQLIKQDLLSSLVQIAERIEAGVIAEGVESEQEASVLLEIGARYGQGFLFAAPQPAAGDGPDGP